MFSVAQTASFQKHKSADVRHFHEIRLSRNVSDMLRVFRYISEDQY